MRVSIMTANPARYTSGTTLQEVAQLMSDHDCGEIPVVENTNNSMVKGVSEPSAAASAAGRSV
jgi:CBS domain-containing protein